MSSGTPDYEALAAWCDEGAQRAVDNAEEWEENPMDEGEAESYWVKSGKFEELAAALRRAKRIEDAARALVDKAYAQPALLDIVAGIHALREALDSEP